MEICISNDLVLRPLLCTLAIAFVPALSSFCRKSSLYDITKPLVEQLNPFISMPLAYFVSAFRPWHIFCSLIYTNCKRVFYFFFYRVSYVSYPCALHVQGLRDDIIYYRLEHISCSCSAPDDTLAEPSTTRQTYVTISIRL